MTNTADNNKLSEEAKKLGWLDRKAGYLHTYFVSYAYVNAGGLALGDIVIDVEEPVTTQKQINELKNYVAREIGAGVSVINFKLIEGDSRAFIMA